MKWPFVLRSTHDRRVAGLQDELHEYREQLNRLRRANIADIAAVVVESWPALQEELLEHRDEFIGGKRG